MALCTVSDQLEAVCSVWLRDGDVDEPAVSQNRVVTEKEPGKSRSSKAIKKIVLVYVPRYYVPRHRCPNRGGVVVRCPALQ